MVSDDKLLRKSIKTLKEEGCLSLLKKGKNYVKSKLHKNKFPDLKNQYIDVLFVNGCYLPHPKRYRVDHQIEQLFLSGYSCNQILYTELTLEYVNTARAFVFYRCPYTEVVGEFIKKARKYNKSIIFDIDDLVIDKSYTDSIPYIKTLSSVEKDQYDYGVEANGKTLSLCDIAITTTEDLALELKKYVKEVYINRNVASEEMLKISNEALLEKKKQHKNKIYLGYFSGSITHNDDICIITPVIVKLMREYDNINLIIAGELDLPDELSAFTDRVEQLKFCDWRNLPFEIARADINLIPLVDTIFNRAKSENKWMESALVEVATIASDVGALHRMIKDGQSGILCKNDAKEWYRKLKYLIDNKNSREEIGRAARKYVLEECTSIRTAFKCGQLYKKLFHPNIIFNVPVLQISGGMNVILKHAEYLQKTGYEVEILNDGNENDDQIEFDDCVFPVVRHKYYGIFAYLDKAVATLFTTQNFVSSYRRIDKRFYLVQNYEVDFNKPGDPKRIQASQSYCQNSGIQYLTISDWCRRWLYRDYEIVSKYAENGIDTSKFYYSERNYNEKIRILIEGNSDDDYKNVDESFHIVDLLPVGRFEIWYVSYQGKPKSWYHIDKFFNKVPYSQMPDLYRSCHILLKTSKLESFSYPPLEMMATGGLVVARENEGNVEYLKDRYNCMFYDPYNLNTAIEIINVLLNDRNYRNKLIENGLKTAESRKWEYIKNNILGLYF